MDFNREYRQMLKRSKYLNEYNDVRDQNFSGAVVAICLLLTALALVVFAIMSIF